MKEENNESLIHLRFDYNEALKSKKDILYSERSLMVIAKVIKEYSSLKTKELNLKLRLHRKLKETATNIRKLQKLIPDVEIPKILKKEEYEKKKDGKEKHEAKLKKETRPIYDKGIELQLQEIQNKLNALQ